jgi:hypothetical protein
VLILALELLACVNSCPAIADMDGDQPVVFYYIDPGYALERHAGKSKFNGKFYYQYEREDSWTHPGVRAFGRVNGGLAFQGFQKIAGNAVPLCHIFYADKAGAGKHCTHHPIYGSFL